MDKQNVRVGIITATDPADKRSWSGTYYRMNKALNEEFSTVINLGPVRLGNLSYYMMHLQLKICEKFHRYVFQKRYNKAHSHIRSRYYGRFFDKVIRKHEIDVLFAPSASTEIAHLKTNIPICYFADATVAIILDYYDLYANFSKKSKKISNEIEQRAINKSVTQVFSSQWAFDSAKQDYGSKNTFIVKFGANIDEEPKDEDLVKQYDSVINILFVGVDWKRKGGDIVLDTIDKLDKNGYNVHLTVIGCVPPLKHPKINVIPFLNKNDKDDMRMLQDLFNKAHLFFLPTRADCTPIVFCEANAYGLPVITTDTGGVSSVIENGVNGFMLPINAGSEDYFKIIADLISDKEKLKKMAISSREKYLKELNWSQWGKEMKKILLLTIKYSDDRNGQI